MVKSDDSEYQPETPSHSGAAMKRSPYKTPSKSSNKAWKPGGRYKAPRQLTIWRDYDKAEQVIGALFTILRRHDITPDFEHLAPQFGSTAGAMEQMLQKRSKEWRQEGRMIYDAPHSKGPKAMKREQLEYTDAASENEVDGHDSELDGEHEVDDSDAECVMDSASKKRKLSPVTPSESTQKKRRAARKRKAKLNISPSKLVDSDSGKESNSGLLASIDISSARKNLSKKQCQSVESAIQSAVNRAVTSAFSLNKKSSKADSVNDANNNASESNSMTDESNDRTFSFAPPPTVFGSNKKQKAKTSRKSSHPFSTAPTSGFSVGPVDPSLQDVSSAAYGYNYGVGGSMMPDMKSFSSQSSAQNMMGGLPHTSSQMIFPYSTTYGGPDMSGMPSSQYTSMGIPPPQFHLSNTATLPGYEAGNDPFFGQHFADATAQDAHVGDAGARDFDKDSDGGAANDSQQTKYGDVDPDTKRQDPGHSS